MSTHMSLLGWLGKDAKAVDPRSLSPLQSRVTTLQSRYALGVLGTRSKTTFDGLKAEIVDPILEAWGLPDELILPSEGDSSHILMTWAHQCGIPVRLIACDWSTHGRRAQMFRDAHIQQTASHLVLMQGPRSNAYSALATRLAKKGRMIALSERPGQLAAPPIK